MTSLNRAVENRFFSSPSFSSVNFLPPPFLAGSRFPSRKEGETRGYTTNQFLSTVASTSTMRGQQHMISKFRRADQVLLILSESILSRQRKIHRSFGQQQQSLMAAVVVTVHRDWRCWIAKVINVHWNSGQQTASDAGLFPKDLFGSAIADDLCGDYKHLSSFIGKAYEVTWLRPHTQKIYLDEIC